MRAFWLVYVVFVFMGPLMGRGDGFDWLLAALSIVVFLPLYLGYWMAMDRRWPYAMVFVAGMAVLGFAFMPLNTGATTYVVYSAALVAFVVSPRVAVSYLGLLAAATFVVAFAYSEPARSFVRFPTLVMIAMIGGGNLFYAEHVRRNALLWRAQEEVEEMAAVAERERISRDLHDLLGHTLSVIALKSELASKLSSTDPARAAEEIREVERVSRDALSEVRAAVEGFRSRGFAGELRSAARTLESAGVRLEADGQNAMMSPRQESVMALALREAVTNIVRHARASTCRVALREEGRRLVLTVQDDGVGGAASEGYGIAGMRERAAALGGDVTVDGVSGTRVTVRLPVSAESGEAPA
jgi:two-component system sensor histidine kinase DesK